MSLDSGTKRASYSVTHHHLDGVEYSLLLAISLTGILLFCVLLMLATRFFLRKRKFRKREPEVLTRKTKIMSTDYQEPVFSNLNITDPNKASIFINGFRSNTSSSYANPSHANSNSIPSLQEIILNDIKYSSLNVPDKPAGSEFQQEQDKQAQNRSEYSLKIELAQHYIEIEDETNARLLLEEVLLEGNATEKAIAKEKYDSLYNIS